jgi:hypothetical protein
LAIAAKYGDEKSDSQFLKSPYLPNYENSGCTKIIGNIDISDKRKFKIACKDRRQRL